MTQRNWLIVAIALLLALIAPHAVEAQNKVKKVKYLGHKYDGEVNQNKIPEGTGTMDFEVFTVKGNFDGSNISNPIFKNSQLHFDYMGDASYNESDNIVLKAGGKMVNYGIRKDVGKEVRLSIFELTKDSVINAESMNTTELFVSYEVPINLPQEIDPPKIVISDVLKLTEYIGRDDKNQYYKAKGFICDDFLEKGKKTRYEDGQGRIWDIEGWKTKVVYPDGSYFNCKNGNYPDDIKIVYPNGDIVEKQDENLWLCLNNGMSFGGIKKMGIAEFVKLCNSKTYPKFEKECSLLKYPNGTKIEVKDSETHVYIPHNNENLHFTIYCANQDSLNIPHVISGKQRLLRLIPKSSSFRVGYDWRRDLSDEELNRIITESFLPLFDILDDEALYFRYGTGDGGNYIGYYYKGKYTTYSDKKKEEENKKKEEENALRADRNKFKAKYGFDPISGSAFKVGRPLATIDTWNKWLKSHGYIGCSFKLSIDQGTSKCFDFYISGKHKGFFWAENNIITSITWY